jgi:ferredoxin
VEGCLKEVDSAISADRELCTGCGLCTTACPSGALSIEGLGDRELLRRLLDGAGEQSLTLTCSVGPGGGEPSLPPGADGAGSAVLPCLAAVTESHLIYLVLKESLSIDLDCTRCDGCAVRGGGDIIRTSVLHAGNFLSALGSSGRITVHTNKRTEERQGKRGKRGVRLITPAPEYSRRQIFALFGGKAREKVAERILGRTGTAESLSDNLADNLAAAVPERRALLLDALGSASPDRFPSLREGDFPFHAISVNGGCVMCRKCESFCPTGAIKRVERDKETQLSFTPALCVGCHQCRELCDEGALSYIDEIKLAPIAEGSAELLATKERHLCANCETFFFPELEREGCPTCRKRSRFDGLITSMMSGDGQGGKASNIVRVH